MTVPERSFLLPVRNLTVWVPSPKTPPIGAVALGHPVQGGVSDEIKVAVDAVSKVA